MIKKISYIVYLVIFLLSIFFTVKYYFSEQNKMLTNKSRSFYLSSLNDAGKDLPLLKNDTNSVIIYKTDIEEFNKKRKKRFWEKLITNQNE